MQTLPHWILLIIFQRPASRIGTTTELYGQRDNQLTEFRREYGGLSSKL